MRLQDSSGTMPDRSRAHTRMTQPVRPADPFGPGSLLPGGAHLLVVDDDPNLLRMLRRGFVLAGYSVEAVEDGEAALRLMREQEPDLVVLDVMLPELDGLEVDRKSTRLNSSHIPLSRM